MDAPDENRHKQDHDWIRIALGRVCTKCQTAQRTGEFDDTVPCRREHRDDTDGPLPGPPPDGASDD